MSKGETGRAQGGNNKTIIMGDTKLPLSDLDKLNKKNKKDVREVNEILEKLELIDMWRKIIRVKKEYTFFSVAFTKIDHVLGHRNMANKYKRAEIINNKFNLFRS